MSVDYEEIELALSKVQMVIILIGLVGNVFSFVVYSKKVFANNSIGVYCRAMAIFDSLTLVQIFIDLFFIFFTPGSSLLASITCKLNHYLIVSFSSISGWILVAFSLDKMACITQRRRFNLIKRKCFQLTTLCVISVSHFILYIIVPVKLAEYETSRLNDSTRCDLSSISFIRVWSVVYFVESSVVPFLLVMIATFQIVKTILCSRRRLMNNQVYYRQRRSKDRQFALNSVILNILFILLKLPISLNYLISSNDSQLDKFILYVTYFVFNLSFSLRFFIHLAFNGMFRNEFLKLIHVRLHLRRKLVDLTQTSFIRTKFSLTNRLVDVG